MIQSARLAYYSWPIGIVVGLGIVVAVNMVMLTLALRGGSELAEHQPYEAGLAFESQLEELKRGVELGVSDALQVGATEADGLRLLEVRMPAAIANSAVDPRVIVIARYAPESAADRQLELLATPESPQLFRTRARLQRGTWQLSLYIEVGKSRIRASRTLLLD